jgi:hypothetical protein
LNTPSMQVHVDQATNTDVNRTMDRFDHRRLAITEHTCVEGIAVKKICTVYMEIRRKKTYCIHLSCICFPHKNRDISINSQAVRSKIYALRCSSCRGSNAGPFPCKGNVITTTLHEPRCCVNNMVVYRAKITRNGRGTAFGAF